MSGARPNLDSLIGAGGIPYVSGLYNSGLGRDDITPLVFKRFPDAPAVSIYALVDRGRAAFLAGSEVNRLADNDRLRVGEYGSGRAGARGFLYTGTVTYLDEESGVTTQRTFQFASPVNLTRGEINDRMMLAAETLQQQKPQYFGRRDLPEGVTPHSVDVYSAHRW